MAVEFIGSLANTSPLASASDGTRGRSGLAEDPDYPARMARIHEEAGYDRVLVSHSAGSPDGIVVAGQVLGATSHLGVLLAHRPGLTTPTVLARQCATLDAFHPGGRVALHVITGGDDRDLARDGDFLDKPSRYQRSDEFLDVVEREWSSATPFDYDGRFYRVAGGLSSIRPAGGHLPVYFAGASGDAVPVGGKHADVYAFWGEPLAAVAERMADVRTAAAAHGRQPRFSVSLRPIPADTEAEAWERAHRILAVEQTKSSNGRDTSGAEGSLRLQRFAAESEIHDKRLWMPLANTPTGFGNATALVGSYEQVAEALLDYVAIGVTTLLINGYEPERDAADAARLIAVVREQERAAASTPTAALPA
jgi:alkanesulfonate monooxygenase